MNGTGQSETSRPLPFGFELGVTSRAMPLTFFVEAYMAEEIGERLVQIAQGLLRSRSSGLSSSTLYGRVHHLSHYVVLSLEENSGIGIEDMQDSLRQCNAVIS